MMKRDEELWVKKMKELLKDYSETPSQEGWSRLEKDLKLPGIRRIRPLMWWSATAAAAVLLTISGIYLFLMQTPTTDDIQPTITPGLTVAPDPIPDEKMPERTKPVLRPIARYMPTDMEATDKSNDTEELTAQPVDPIKEEQEVRQSGERRVLKPSGKDKLHLPDDHGRRSTKGRWALSASVSNVPSTSSAQGQTYLMMANVASTNTANSEILVVETNSLVFDKGVPYLRETALISEVKHKQPVSFGLSVRRNLGHGFSVESGVTYTMLSSEGKSLVDESNKIKQTLHYIGIPVRGNFDFFDSKRFTAYATVGGMVEKCVYGKIGSERHTVKPMQLSVMGGVGAQLNLTNRIGIYIEPGISYFFDDGSDIETIRKETPLNFNLQAGIRFRY